LPGKYAISLINIFYFVRLIAVYEQIKADKEKTTVPVKMQQGKIEIPKFDLAEKIMAEQRRVTAIQRKAPCKKDKAQKKELKAESISYTTEQPMPLVSEQEQIIADIVARDIAKLRRYDTPNLY